MKKDAFLMLGIFVIVLNNQLKCYIKIARKYFGATEPTNPHLNILHSYSNESVQISA